MAGQYGEFVINLRRDTLSTSWGFRLQGGKECNAYLSVQRVFNGSPSDGRLQRGDVIVAVDNEDVSQWYQKQAYDLIQSIGLTLALVVRRGGSDFDARPTPPSQTQPAASFVRKPFGQQQQQQQEHQAQSQHHQYAPHQQQQQQLSPQMTSKATLTFQSAPSQPYAHPPPSHLSSTDRRENARPTPAAASGITPWNQQHSPGSNQNSFSTPFQVRSVQGPQASYSPQQQSDSYGPGKAQLYAGGQHHQGSNQAAYQSDQRDSYQFQSPQQPSYHDESNHVTYDRNQSTASAAQENRHEPVHNEGGEGEGQEGEDYQALSVRDIKQMFNKPDQKDVRGPVSHIKRSHVAWTKPQAEATLSPGAYGASGPRPGQHSSLSPTRPGSIQRCPPLRDDFRKSYSPPAQPNFGQPRFASPPGVGKPTATANVNKLGGAFAGIIQPALPPKTVPVGKSAQKGQQKKKDFDPNQSAVYKILLEEEERAKAHPHQQDEEEEEESPRRQTQGPKQGQRKAQPPQTGQRPQQKQQQESRLTELLERDSAQLAPYKEEEHHQEQRVPYQKQQSPYQEPRAPHQDQRLPYQEPRAPHQEQRSPYQEPRAPHQEQRSPYQEPRASYQEQRSPYQEPKAPTYQDPGSSQPYRNDIHQHQNPARGVPVAWQGATAGPTQDYGSSFLQTQYVDGIPTSDF